MPNPNTLEWLHYQDIQIPDVTLRQQFRQYIQTGQYAQALAILTNNADQLKGKVYIADTINTIINGVVNLQERYNTGVTVYLADLLTQFNILVDNLKRKGTWQSTVQYTPYNFVVYNNEVYMCIAKPSIGTLPTDTTYWLYLGLRGQQGDPGIDVNMTFDWNSGKPYQPNDLVVYQGNIYCAKIANTGIVPIDEDTWGLFLLLGEGKINVGVNPPDKPARDMIWFQTQSDPDSATTANPIIGTFKRYNRDTEQWDDMYPNVLFTWIDGAGSYAPIKQNDDITIAVADWQNNEWTYTNPAITANSVIEVWPNNLSAVQYTLYNNLSIVVNTGSLTLTSSITPGVELPITITIQ